MVKTFILVLWQLPQHILAVILLLVYRPKRENATGILPAYWHSRQFPGGISLGFVSIVRTGSPGWLIKHEAIGHAKQSKRWGPLYLLVVGLPSILTAWLGIRWPRGWPEDQADRLGGVERL